jgi:arsenate reductase
MRYRIESALFVVASIVWPEIAGSQSRGAEGRGMERSQIVFVCEHGAALSVVSAAYFNKLAREWHLNLHAIARGTAPQRDIAVSAREGLKADGVPFATKRPQPLSRNDAAHALRIVAFTPLPARFSRVAPVQTWEDVPPTSANYGRARDAIVKHIKTLLSDLQPDVKEQH